jgi:hypothetical protein
LNNNFFPPFVNEQGNACSGVEVKTFDAAVKNGCGCKPANTAPCTFSTSPTQLCKICTAKDFLALSTSPPILPETCSKCFECMTNPANGGCDAALATCVNNAVLISVVENCLDNLLLNTCRDYCFTNEPNCINKFDAP